MIKRYSNSYITIIRYNTFINPIVKGKVLKVDFSGFATVITLSLGISGFLKQI